MDTYPWSRVHFRIRPEPYCLTLTFTPCDTVFNSYLLVINYDEFVELFC